MTRHKEAYNPLLRIDTGGPQHWNKALYPLGRRDFLSERYAKGNATIIPDTRSLEVLQTGLSSSNCHRGNTVALQGSPLVEKHLHHPLG